MWSLANTTAASNHADISNSVLPVMSKTLTMKKDSVPQKTPAMKSKSRSIFFVEFVNVYYYISVHIRQRDERIDCQQPYMQPIHKYAHKWDVILSCCYSFCFSVPSFHFVLAF